MKNKSFRSALAIGTALVLILPLLSVAAPPTGIEPLAARTSATSRPSAENADAGPSERSFPFDRLEVGPTPLVNRDAAARTQPVYGRLPLSFEANQGQTDSRVKFLSRGGGSTLFLTSTEAVVVLTRPVAKSKRGKFSLVKPDLTQPGKVTRTIVRMGLFGANPAPRVAGLEELPGKVNYFIGNDPAKWRTNVPTYKAEFYRLHARLFHVPRR